MKRVLRESSSKRWVEEYLDGLQPGEKGSYADFQEKYPNISIAPSTYQMTRAAILRSRKAEAGSQSWVDTGPVKPAEPGPTLKQYNVPFPVKPGSASEALLDLGFEYQQSGSFEPEAPGEYGIRIYSFGDKTLGCRIKIEVRLNRDSGTKQFYAAVYSGYNSITRKAIEVEKFSADAFKEIELKIREYCKKMPAMIKAAKQADIKAHDFASSLRRALETNDDFYWLEDIHADFDEKVVVLSGTGKAYGDSHEINSIYIISGDTITQKSGSAMGWGRNDASKGGTLNRKDDSGFFTIKSIIDQYSKSNGWTIETNVYYD